MSSNSAPRLRCAAYTRKSSEEGLDQEFNSLDAQREACVAFIASQVGLGWKLVPDRYDDGGISGGTMERPALQRLLQDIRDKKVDVVVVYKIDRLTRSLMDFSKMVEIFDASSASFVSVTQQFNTTTSMGRLTLNVLLSFAQFEREVTGERIRDKIAASKKKGMWTGGTVPLGYQVRDRKLIPKEPEASFVRNLFARYQQLRSGQALVRELSIRTLTPESSSQSEKIGYTREVRLSTLYRVLANPVYVGKLRHRQNVYDGEHDPIVEADQFAAVQALLAERAATPRGSVVYRDSHTLSGLLFDDTGDRMAPTHTNKRGTRYRYYMSGRLRVAKADDIDGWRISARELENAVREFAIRLLNDKSRLADWIAEHSAPNRIQYGLAHAQELGGRLHPHQSTAIIRGAFQLLFRSITLMTTAIRFSVNVRAIVRALAEPVGVTLSSDDGTRDENSTVVAIDLPIGLRRRTHETKLIIDSIYASTRAPDESLVTLIAKAHLLFGKLTESPSAKIGDIAKDFGIHRADVGRILPLAFLAPKLVEEVLQGRQPPTLSSRNLARMHLPLLWAEQTIVPDRSFKIVQPSDIVY